MSADHAPAVGELAVTGSAQLNRVTPCGRCGTVIADLFAALDDGDDERAAELLDELERWVTA